MVTILEREREKAEGYSKRGETVFLFLAVYWSARLVLTHKKAEVRTIVVERVERERGEKGGGDGSGSDVLRGGSISHLQLEVFLHGFDVELSSLSHVAFLRCGSLQGPLHASPARAPRPRHHRRGRGRRRRQVALS